jgi:hypothetical protein
MVGFKRQRQMFAAQFEADGGGYIYRSHTVGEPIRVSAVDRDRYVANFERFTRQGFWGAVVAAALLLAALVAYSFTTGTEVPDLVFYAAFGGMIVVYVVGYQRAWNLPARELRRGPDAS